MLFVLFHEGFLKEVVKWTRTVRKYVISTILSGLFSACLLDIYFYCASELLFDVVNCNLEVLPSRFFDILLRQHDCSAIL